MEDKELFENVEKTFSLNKNSVKINEVFNKGNFKKNLNEVVEPKDSSSNIAGGIGKAISYMSPSAIRMRKAQARQAEADAAKTRASMLDNDKKKVGSKNKPTDKNRLDVYNNDSRYKRVWDAYDQGKERDVSISDIDYYNKIETKLETEKIEDIQRIARDEAETKVKVETAYRVKEQIVNLLTKRAPKIAEYLRTNKLLNLYSRYMLNSKIVFGDNDGPERKEIEKLDDNEILKLADKLTGAFENHPGEVKAVRNLISDDDRLTGADKKRLLVNLPTAEGVKTVTTSGKKKRKPRKTVAEKIKDLAIRNDMTIPEMKAKLNDQAKKIAVGTIVVGGKGGKYKVIGYNSKNGTLRVQNIKGENSSKGQVFARDVKVSSQQEFDLQNGSKLPKNKATKIKDVISKATA